VLAGGRLSRPVAVPVGRVHYGGIRIIGTAGFDPAESMRHIPGNGEIRPGDCINIIGAAGPMGVMHVIRNICQGEKGVSIFAGDLDQQRLAQLDRIAGLLTRTNKVHYESYNPNRTQPEKAFDYVVLMAPVAPLVAASVKTVAAHAIINIFAGIPAAVVQELDLQCYLEKHLYFIGTSGSVLEDMKTVLRKVETGRLDSNLSVAAISGLDGAIEGLRAVEKQAVPGKIIVYPACRGLGLIPLDRLDEYLPEVAALTPGGLWNRQAEDKLLEVFSPAI
jgi:L-sorbose 1-phosphate reductase